MPKVSVVVPIYNVEEYLPKCIESLINQTLSDIEIILVNDGTPDNSQDIIDKYKKKDKRIVSIIKENGGQGSARNLGVTKARGEYISFIDSDDWVEDNMLEFMYNEAKINDLDIVICGYKNIYKNYDEECFISKEIMEDTLNNKNTKIFNTISSCCKIYKREFLINSEVTFKEDKIWYEDLPYCIKVLSLTDKIGFVNKTLYNYYFRENSTMNNSKVLKNLDLLIMFDDVISFMKDKNMYDKYYSEIEYLAIDHILISGITRLVRFSKDKKIRNEVINKYISYMKDNFTSYKNNKYLSLLSRNRKIIYRLVLLKQYWLISLIFKIKH